MKSLSPCMLLQDDERIQSIVVGLTPFTSDSVGGHVSFQPSATLPINQTQFSNSCPHEQQCINTFIHSLAQDLRIYEGGVEMGHKSVPQFTRTIIPTLYIHIARQVCFYE